MAKRSVRRKRRGHLIGRTRQWRGTDLVVTYAYRGVDRDKDSRIVKALAPYDTGSGVAFLANPVRDHTATIPESAYKRVVTRLKKIDGITIKRRDMRWVRVR